MFKDLLIFIKDTLKAFFSKVEVLVIIAVIGVNIILALYNVNFINAIVKFIKYSWWFWAFIFLLKIFEDMWLFWRQQIFQKNLPWMVMEIVIPREVKKTPKAMEQVLRAIHSLRNSAGDPQEKYWDGEVTRWYALEMASFGGEVHFYIRFYAKQKNLIEAAFGAHYPEVELVEVEDYMKKLPQTTEEAYAQGKNLWGTELSLVKDEIYPIVSYTQFVNEIDEERRVDPISAFIEVLSKLHQSEYAGVQMLIAPAGDEWKKPWEKFVQDLKEKTTSRMKQAATVEDESQSSVARTPGEIELLKDLDNNLSKPSFDAILRFIYISPKELFIDTIPRRGLTGAFNQYSSFGRNSFKRNAKTETRARIWFSPYLFPKIRGEFRKQRLLYNYLTRKMIHETFMGKVITSHFFNWNVHSKSMHLSVESMATLFHPPTEVVLTAPHIVRAESRKAAPPAGLAIYGEEENIEQYK